MDETVSTMNMTSGNSLMTSAISARGDMTPVEVSLWIMVMLSYFPLDSACSTASGVTGLPQSKRMASACLPQRRVTSCHLSEKAPLQKLAQRFPTRFRTAPSITPKALDVARKTRSPVNKTFLRPAVTRPCNSAYSFMRWPIMGVAMAARISGWTSTGPGMNNFLCMQTPGLRENPVL